MKQMRLNNSKSNETFYFNRYLYQIQVRFKHLPVVVLTSQRKSVKLSSLKPPGRDSLMPLAICTGPIPFQLYDKSSVVQPST